MINVSGRQISVVTANKGRLFEISGKSGITGMAEDRRWDKYFLMNGNDKAAEFDSGCLVKYHTR
jgi:hypothetical protein